MTLDLISHNEQFSSYIESPARKKIAGHQKNQLFRVALSLHPNAVVLKRSEEYASDL
jgi:hypothetical protein